MMVIKKKGDLQEFDLGKIERSIINSGKDVNYEFTMADINLICNDVHEKLKSIRNDGSNTSSYEINALVIDTLKVNGFTEVVKAYYNF